MRKQTGFTLIEILVTVVVTAIGLLGLAGLQTIALRFNSTSYQRSQATVLAYDITERMRASKPAGGVVDCPQGEVSNWQTLVAATLPSGTGNVAGPFGNACVITIQWDDSRGQDDPKRFEMRTSL
ncbi:MAG: type IV pilus modification protein PilV [Candidatus Competibacteraceae bacterium]|nr:type IV pilus modification protein PilV [Candidatus Competibacteraceae bacterium]